jgi:hypothetical protein
MKVLIMCNGNECMDLKWEKTPKTAKNYLARKKHIGNDIT